MTVRALRGRLERSELPPAQAVATRGAFRASCYATFEDLVGLA